MQENGDEESDEFPEPDDDGDVAEVPPAEYQSKNVVLKQSKSTPGRFFLWHHDMQISKWHKYKLSDIEGAVDFAIGEYEGAEFVYPVIPNGEPKTIQKWSKMVALGLDHYYPAS